MEVKNNNLEVNSSQCVTRIIFGEVIAALHRTICVWLSVIVMCSAFQFVQKHLEEELIRNVVGEKKNNFHVNPALISIWFEWRKKSCQYLLVCVCARGKQFFSVLKRKATITTARTFIHVSKQQKTIEVTLNNAWFWFGRSCVRKCVCVCVCLHTVALSKKCWISVSSISGICARTIT